MKKWFKTILVIGILLLGYSFYSFYVERQTIEYVNNSSLFEYYSEYQILYGQKNFDSKMFAEWIKKRDINLGQIMEMKKFHYLNDDGYKGFYWASKPNLETSSFSEYSFLDFFKQKKSIEFHPSEIKAKYESGYYYEVDNDSLGEGKKMNLENLLREYKHHLKCKKVFSNALNTKTISMFFNIENLEIRIIYSDFNKESEEIIKEMATNHGSNINSSFFLLFDFPDLEDFKCN